MLPKPYSTLLRFALAGALALAATTPALAQGGSLSGKLKFSGPTTWRSDCAEREQLVGRRGQLLTDQLYTLASADAGADVRFEVVPVFDEQPEVEVTDLACAQRDGRQVLRVHLRVTIGPAEGTAGFVEVASLTELATLVRMADALKAQR